MPSTNSQISFRTGTYSGYSSKQDKDDNSIYFCTDTRQIFIGASEYTKGTKILSEAPTSQQGDPGTLYTYNGNLYLCQLTGTNVYSYSRVANVNDKLGTVTSVIAGDGLVSSSGSTITSSGTLEHNVPQGANVQKDAISNQTPTHGQTFNIESVETDKFGHVTSVNLHTVTLPNVEIVSQSSPDRTLLPGDSFTVVSSIFKDTEVNAITKQQITLTLPDATSYVIESGSTDGTIKVTPKGQDAYEVTVQGWSDLAKRSDLTTVFKYIGSVESLDDLPTDIAEGSVVHVVENASEYVYAVVDGNIEPTWECLGGVLDLSEYAKSTDVIPRVTGATGNIPKFNSDGTLSASSHTLDASVPADAIFKYTAGDGINIEGAQVINTGVTSASTGSVSGSIQITKQGVPEDILVAGLGSAAYQNVSSFAPTVHTHNYAGSDSVGGAATTALNCTGNSATATKATQDQNGNVINTTYATKTEVDNAKPTWEEF